MQQRDRPWVRATDDGRVGATTATAVAMPADVYSGALYIASAREARGACSTHTPISECAVRRARLSLTVLAERSLATAAARLPSSDAMA